MKFDQTLNQIISLDLKVGITPALFGDPGIGKSSFVEALARQHGTRCFVMPCNQLADKADLTGSRLVPVDGDYVQRFFPHEVITSAITYAEQHPDERPILFLDEVNRTTSDITSASLTLVTLRRMGYKELPDNLRLVIAGNDKGNIVTLDDASLSRFSIYHVEPDAENLIRILGDSLHPLIKEVLREHPEYVYLRNEPAALAVDGSGDDDDDEEEEQATIADLFDTGESMAQFTTPRTIDALSRYLSAAPEQLLIQWLGTTMTRSDGTEVSYLQEVLESHTGATAFTAMVLKKLSDTLVPASSGGNGAPAMTLTKPLVFAGLVKAATTSRSDLENAVSQLSDEAASACLVWALYSDGTSPVVIETLNERLSQATMPAEYNRKLMNLVMNEAIPQRNFDTFLSLSGGVSAAVKPILAGMGLL